MTHAAECLSVLLQFVQSGPAEETTTPAEVIRAYLATLSDMQAQVVALDDLQSELVERCASLPISGEAEDRHVAIEDVILDAQGELQGALKAQSQR